MPTTCTRCGSALGAIDRFCPSCGTPVPQGGQVDDVPAPPTPTAVAPGTDERGLRDRIFGFLPRKLRLPAMVVSIFLVVIVVLAAIGSDGTGGAGDGTLGGDYEPIASESRAQFMVKEVLRTAYNGVVDEIPNGEHDGLVIEGASGRAVVTGTRSYQSGQSCGTDCVSSQNNHDLTIVFEDFSYSRTTIDGTVSYRDTTWSQTSGVSGYSSGGSVMISGAEVQVLYESSLGDDEIRYGDVMTFSASANSPNVGNPSGSCTPSNGARYRF